MRIKIGRRRECDPAVLVCSNGCGLTEHVYVGLRDLDGDDELAGCEEVYECTACKARRRWGVISAAFKPVRLASCARERGAWVHSWLKTMDRLISLTRDWSPVR